MIATEEITKSYRRNLVLRGITFCAAADEITLLVGPNGAGKSTTMKVLAGLIRPNSGHARINKIDIVAQRIEAQRSLAYLPQRPSFHPRMHVELISTTSCTRSMGNIGYPYSGRSRAKRI